MTYLKELLDQVLSSLFRNKLRSLLTMGGIAWGVASIVLIVAMGDGFKEGQRNSMRGLGEYIVIVFGGRTERQAGGQRAGRRIRLNYQDVRDIRAECYLVQLAAGEMESMQRASSPYNAGSFDVNGVEPVYPELRTIPIAEGRFFSDEDEKEARRVCVLGRKVKKQLFADRGGVLGSTIAINGLPFEVIAVMADKNQNSSYSGLDENKIYVPYSVSVRDFPWKLEFYMTGMLDDIIYKPKSLDDFAAARKQVLRILGRNHRFDPDDKGAVNVWDTVENAQQVDAIFESMTVFLGMIALVTLTLGGVGVMNIMLVTVTERTREVGLRKALGATRSRILIDFLVEGCILAFASGLAGWSVAFGLSALLKLAPMPDMFPGLPVSMTTTAYAFIALAVIAIASALLPAWRAATLTPVEALRYER